MCGSFTIPFTFGNPIVAVFQIKENANKNPVVNSTQRDYMAGEVSRDITNRILLFKAKIPTPTITIQTTHELCHWLLF